MRIAVAGKPAQEGTNIAGNADALSDGKKIDPAGRDDSVFVLTETSFVLLLRGAPELPARELREPRFRIANQALSHDHQRHKRAQNALL